MSALAPQHPPPPQQQFRAGQQDGPRRPSAFRKFVGRLRSGSLSKSNHKGSLIPDDDDGQEDGHGLDGLNSGGGGNVNNNSNEGPSSRAPSSSSPPLALAPSPPMSPEPAARTRKRGSITHSAAAWTAKMRGAGIGGVGNGAPGNSSGRRDSNASAAAPPPPAGPPGIAQDLWNEAYNALRDGDATARLTSTYESIVSREVPKYLKLGGNASLSGQSDHERAELFSAVAKAGMQKRRASQVGLEDEDDDHTARDMLVATKSAVETVLPEFPIAGLAWAGLCIMTPSLLDPVIERNDMRGGLIHILGRVSWYMQLAQLLEAKSWTDERLFADRQPQSRGALVGLFRNVLELEMNCVCASACETNAAARDVVSWNDIRGLLRDIMRADEGVVDMVMQHCVDPVKEELLGLDNDFKPPEEGQNDQDAAEEEQLPQVPE
ncbi:ankyrin repeat protein [Hirsutella rhossiliensis]|uniref:Ankyrin repeat protein n=1 Tax=Hirsutella rhossiliensis TaxID=111463 RepID=A0A9P8MLQ7_9HYPO|nr:ankyrin repeat protein [Hirsutella rhossiliensis]KAH0957593.1 ankyrin repeat protein [Hirsutella rhossiliensis]